MKMRLENWSIVLVGDVYTPPEMRKQCLNGQVYGNPRFDDGDDITTSSIKITPMVNGCVFTASGSMYELGTVSPAYEAEYPDANNRLVNFLNSKE